MTELNRNIVLVLSALFSLILLGMTIMSYHYRPMKVKKNKEKKVK